MKFSNFKLTEMKGTTAINKEFFATVDVETGVLFWKRKSTRKIRRVYGGFWHFVDTGKYTPNYQVEDLARAWTAHTGQET